MLDIYCLWWLIWNRINSLSIFQKNATRNYQLDPPRVRDPFITDLFIFHRKLGWIINAIVWEWGMLLTWRINYYDWHLLMQYKSLNHESLMKKKNSIFKQKRRARNTLHFFLPISPWTSPITFIIPKLQQWRK